MRRKRVTAWILVLAAAITARVAVAAPSAAIAMVRAAVCCAERCPDRPPAPHRCCFVDASATDPASTAAAPSVERPATMAIALPPAIGPIVTPSVVTARFEGAIPRTGPPGHPETQKLRC